MADRLMIAERHLTDDNEKIKILTAEVEEGKIRIIAVEEQRDAARAAEEALRVELEQLRKAHTAEKVALVQKTIEDYKKSEAFDLELEETFTQAFEVARARAGKLFPDLDFSALQPVDSEDTSVEAEEREGGEEVHSKAPPPPPPPSV